LSLANLLTRIRFLGLVGYAVIDEKLKKLEDFLEYKIFGRIGRFNRKTLIIASIDLLGTFIRNALLNI